MKSAHRVLLCSTTGRRVSQSHAVIVIPTDAGNYTSHYTSLPTSKPVDTRGVNSKAFVFLQCLQGGHCNVERAIEAYTGRFTISSYQRYGDSGCSACPTFPHDALRLGLRTLKDENAVVHPLEATQKNMSKHRDDTKVAMMKDIYGTGLAARYQIEKQILCRAGGLPGRVPTNLGWEVLSGGLDDIGPESYLGRPEDSVTLPPDFHSQMESQLKMKTKPMTRGVF